MDLIIVLVWFFAVTNAGLESARPCLVVVGLMGWVDVPLMLCLFPAQEGGGCRDNSVRHSGYHWVPNLVLVHDICSFPLVHQLIIMNAPSIIEPRLNMALRSNSDVSYKCTTVHRLRPSPTTHDVCCFQFGRFTPAILRSGMSSIGSNCNTLVYFRGRPNSNERRH